MGFPAGQRSGVERTNTVDECGVWGHEENAMTAKDLSVNAAAKGQGVSGYGTLSLWQSAKSFKVNTAVCFAVAFSAATDGYQIGSVQLFLRRLSLGGFT
ncbi:hypothetical protein EDB80DRAFT_723194 [Ilyonectria destructans]|nr:hypothetical protein EDB80DRAFT_723194 [Ilyonectria destructans]